MSEMSEETKQEAGKIYNVSSVENMYVDTMIVQAPAPEPQKLPAPAAKKDYITDEKKSRCVLDDYDDEAEFEFYPDRLYVLSLYFITLSEGQERYALLDYVSYAPMVKDGRVNDDIWSVPYTITPIDLGGRKVRKVKEIKSVYSEALPGLTDTLSTTSALSTKRLKKARSTSNISNPRPSRTKCAATMSVSSLYMISTLQGY